MLETSPQPPATRTRPAPEPSRRIDPATRGYDRPVLFYVLATLVPWIFWLGAAWFSHRADQTDSVRAVTSTLGLIGLAAPVAVVWWLVRDKPELRADLRARLLWRRGASTFHVVCAVVLLLASILAAQAVSVLFGYGIDQFQFRDGFSFTSGLLPVWVILVLAPILEEVAWHGYGTDALVARMRLLTASLVFSAIWAVWHLPLSFIQGYYHSDLVQSGWLHALNFPLSMIPFVVLMNWLYYRTGRSITVTIVFHISAGFVNEIFMTDPDTKLIQTALLLVLTVVVVVRNRELFLTRPTTLSLSDAGRCSGPTSS